MGIKIHELNTGISVANTDLFPLTQDIGNSQRKTLKATALQIKDNFNADVLNRLNDLSVENDNNKIDKTNFDKFLPRKSGQLTPISQIIGEKDNFLV